MKIYVLVHAATDFAVSYTGLTEQQVEALIAETYGASYSTISEGEYQDWIAAHQPA